MNDDDIKSLFENTSWPAPRANLRAIVLDRIDGSDHHPSIMAAPPAAVIQAAQGFTGTQHMRMIMLGLTLAAGILTGFLTMDTGYASPPYFAGAGSMLAQALSF